jgi:phenylacetate-CoA ligase
MWRSLLYLPLFYKNQYRSPESLRQFQESRLRHIVSFAYRNVPLYHHKFKERGLTPSDVTTLRDLTKIPITTKEEIKAGFPHKSVAPGYSESNCVTETTSGTSGNMLTVLYDKKASEILRAVAFRAYLAQGLRPWHTYCVMCRDPAEFSKATEGVLIRTRGLLEGAPESELVEELRAIHPDVIGAHPSLFVAMAKIMEKKAITDITPRMLLIGGEMAYPVYREYIERIFGCPTFNKYGAYEAISLAWECAHHTMHIDADSVIMEFIRDGEPVSPGERGEILITNLWNEAMPFLRYRLDDVGVLSDEACPCGRTLPALKEIEGKLDDFVILPSGELIPSTRIVPYFFIVPHIGQFKVLQNSPDHVELRIVPLKEFTDAMEKELVTCIQRVLGETVTVTIKKVDHIDITGQGKYKRVQRTFRADFLL